MRLFRLVLVLAWFLVPAFAWGEDVKAANGRALPHYGGSESASANAVATVATPQFGGSVVLVGPWTAEVLPRPNGWVEAVLTAADGSPVRERDVSVALRIGGGANGTRTATLRWDASLGVFTGPVSGAGPWPSGPVSLAVTQGSRTWRGDAGAAPLIPLPRRGGVVLSLSRHVFEVVALQSGAVEAFVRDTTSSVPPTPWWRHVDLLVAVQGHDGEPYPVSLTWDDDGARFRGHAPAGVQLGHGPVDAVLTEHAREYRGGVSAAVALPWPRAGGTVIGTDRYSVEVAKGSSGMLEAFVWDGNGRAPRRSTYRLSVSVVDIGGTVYPVSMNWSQARARHVGRAPIHLDQVAAVHVEVDSPRGLPQTPRDSAAGSTVAADSRTASLALVGYADFVPNSRSIRDEPLFVRWPGRIDDSDSDDTRPWVRVRSSERAPLPSGIDVNQVRPRSDNAVWSGGSDRGSITKGLAAGIY